MMNIKLTEGDKPSYEVKKVKRASGGIGIRASLRNIHSSLRNNRAFLTETIKAINIYIIRLLSINNPTTQVCRSCRRFAISTVDIHLCGNNHRKCSHNVYTSTKDTIPITA